MSQQPHLSRCVIDRVASVCYSQSRQRLEFVLREHGLALWYSCTQDDGEMKLVDLAAISDKPLFFVYRPATGQLMLEPKVAI